VLARSDIPNVNLSFGSVADAEVIMAFLRTMPVESTTYEQDANNIYITRGAYLSILPQLKIELVKYGYAIREAADSSKIIKICKDKKIPTNTDKDGNVFIDRAALQDPDVVRSLLDLYMTRSSVDELPGKLESSSLEYLLEAFFVDYVGKTSDRFYLNIGGTYYGYVPRGMSVDDMIRKFKDISKYSQGRALAFVKKNCEYIDKQTSLPHGLKESIINEVLTSGATGFDRFFIRGEKIKSYRKLVLRVYNGTIESAVGTLSTGENDDLTNLKGKKLSTIRSWLLKTLAYSGLNYPTSKVWMDSEYTGELRL